MSLWNKGAGIDRDTTAAFEFLRQMLPPQPDTPELKLLAMDLKQRFSESIERDEAVKPQLRITMPDAAALDTLAESLARLLAGVGGKMSAGSLA